MKILCINKLIYNKIIAFIRVCELRVQNYEKNL